MSKKKLERLKNKEKVKNFLLKLSQIWIYTFPHELNPKL